MRQDAKIIFFGNVANNFFRVAEILKENGYPNVEVLISGDEDSTNLPSSDGQDHNSIANISNDWKLKSLLLSRKSRLRFKLADADYVFYSSTNLLACLFTPKKVRKIFFATGADLTVFPFFFRNVYFRSKHRKNTITDRIKIIIYSLFISAAMKIALFKVDVIYAYPFKPFHNALNQLKIPATKLSPDYLPVLLDSDKFKYKPAAETDAGKFFQELTKNSRLIIFCPSRIMIQDSYFHLATGQYKGQERLVKVFADFIKSGSEYEDSILVFIEREDDSIDRKTLLELINEKDLEENIIWLRPINGLFSRTELMDFYSHSNVIYDEYGVGWFGSVSLEGMSCRRPVICYLDTFVMNKLYNSNPFLTFDSDSCLKEMLIKLHRDSAFLEHHGKVSRDWIVENHSKKKVIEFFTNLN